MAVAKARVWASEGWEVTIIVQDEEEIAVESKRLLLACVIGVPADSAVQ